MRVVFVKIYLSRIAIHQRAVPGPVPLWWYFEVLKIIYSYVSLTGNNKPIVFSKYLKSLAIFQQQSIFCIKLIKFKNLTKGISAGDIRKSCRNCIGRIEYPICKILIGL